MAEKVVVPGGRDGVPGGSSRRDCNPPGGGSIVECRVVEFKPDEALAHVLRVGSCVPAEHVPLGRKRTESGKPDRGFMNDVKYKNGRFSTSTVMQRDEKRNEQGEMLSFAKQTRSTYRPSRAVKASVPADSSKQTSSDSTKTTMKREAKKL